MDVCPEGVGFILSVGRVSVWLNTSDALDVAQALARALEQEVVAGQAKPEEEPATERSIAAILMPVKS